MASIGLLRLFEICDMCNIAEYKRFPLGIKLGTDPEMAHSLVALLIRVCCSILREKSPAMLSPKSQNDRNNPPKL